jgi:hypothetical protein
MSALGACLLHLWVEALAHLLRAYEEAKEKDPHEVPRPTVTNGTAAHTALKLIQAGFIQFQVRLIVSNVTDDLDAYDVDLADIAALKTELWNQSHEIHTKTTTIILSEKRKSSLSWSSQSTYALRSFSQQIAGHHREVIS